MMELSNLHTIFVRRQITLNLCIALLFRAFHDVSYSNLAPSLDVNREETTQWLAPSPLLPGLHKIKNKVEKVCKGFF